MTRLAWGVAGERFYETGADQGVLYIGTSPGVPWNGLTAVNEKPSGGEPQPFYFDGFKYSNLSAAEEYEATLEAFSSPAEFGPCDGTGEIYPGLFITQQPRVPFGLSYRTLIGNDVDGQDHGRKIHLVYNALASPASRSNNTVNDSPEPAKFGWGITAKPPALFGHRPSAHLMIDSRYTPPDLLLLIEDMLYGDDVANARLPSQQEIITLFEG